MSQELLDQYPHAMVIDQETGKPMPKVSTSGSSGGGGDVIFPNNYPDSEGLNAMITISEHIVTVTGEIVKIQGQIQELDSKLKGLVDGTSVITVKIEEPIVEEEV